MGRKSAFDRQNAIDHVTNLIWQDGYNAWSVKAISEELGITRSSFYNAFGDKEQLFFEVLDHYLTHSPDRCLQDIEESDSITGKITHLFLVLCQLRAADPYHRGCLAINAVAELVGPQNSLDTGIVDIIQFRLERLQHLLDLAVKRGELPSDCDTRTTALVLQNALMGLNILAKVVYDEQELLSVAVQTLKSTGIYQEN